MGSAPHNASNIRTVSISMPLDLFNEVREQAVAADRSMSNMVCVLARRGLKAKEQQS